MWKLYGLGLLLSLAHFISANTNDQVGADIDYGTFESPSARVRPRFRYWLPDASVDPTTVKENIQSAGAVGAGGVEFLPFYNYGGEMDGTPPGADWSTYGFGTEAFKEMFLTALKAHKDAGLVMDFPLGPNQGQGVPAEFDDQGLQWDLVSFILDIENITRTDTYGSEAVFLNGCPDKRNLRRYSSRLGNGRAGRIRVSRSAIIQELHCFRKSHAGTFFNTLYTNDRAA